MGNLNVLVTEGEAGEGRRNVCILLGHECQGCESLGVDGFAIKNLRLIHCPWLMVGREMQKGYQEVKAPGDPH